VVGRDFDGGQDGKKADSSNSRADQVVKETFWLSYGGGVNSTALAKYEPCKFERIARLESLATATHGPQPNGKPRSQWADKTTDYWRTRASQGDWIDSQPVDTPCGCFDG
jgi:hypothetical protein